LFDYTSTGKTPRQVRRDLGTCDIIHANGGSTFHLLLQAQRSGFIKFIREFVGDAGIYIGSSAGSIIDGPDIGVSRRLESKPFRRQLAGYKGFGLVDFVTLAHWGEKSCEKFYLAERRKLVYRCDEKIIRNYSPVLNVVVHA
jgi:peptidase E